MFCRKCGNEIPSDSVFCPICGFSTASAPGTVQQQVQSQSPLSDSPLGGITYGDLIPNSEESKKSDKKTQKSASKKKKKIILAVISSVLVLALIITGSIMIPNLIFEHKMELRTETIENIKAEYHAGNFTEAHSLAASLPFNDSDQFYRQEEVINRIIDFGEELSSWEGTSYELLDKIEALIEDITDMEYHDTYLYITSLYQPDNENLMYYLTSVIPELRKELDIMSELTAIMENYGDNFYKYCYEIYNLYCKSSFSRNEATTIDSAIVSGRRTALDALNELQSRNPDFALISECITMVGNDYSCYTEHLKPYLFDVTYQNGYVTISDSQGKSARDKIPKFIGLNSGSNVLQSGLSVSFGYRHAGLSFPSPSEEIQKNNLNLSITDYTIFRIAYLLNGNREISFAEDGFHEDIAHMMGSIEKKYAP